MNGLFLLNKLKESEPTLFGIYVAIVSYMKVIINFIFVFILMVTLQSCQAYQVIDSGYDANFDFSKYKSFSWLPVRDTTNNSLYDNQEFRTAIIQDFTKQIIKRKYLLETDTPDFYLDLTITYSKEIRYEDSLVPQIHSYPYYVQPRYYQNKYVTRRVDYVKDYVTINMVDRKTNQLMMSVTSEADIDRGGDIPDTYNSITRNILRKFLKMKKYAATST